MREGEGSCGNINAGHAYRTTTVREWAGEVAGTAGSIRRGLLSNPKRVVAHKAALALGHERAPDPAPSRSRL